MRASVVRASVAVAASALSLCPTACSMLTDTGGLVEPSGEREETSRPRVGLSPSPGATTSGAGSSSAASRDDDDEPSTPAANTSANTSAWCQALTARPRECFDFESGALPSLGKNTAAGTLVVMGGALVVEMADGESGPALLRVPLVTKPDRVNFSFEVRLDEVRSSRSVEFGELEFEYADGLCAIQPTVLNGRIYINEYCAGGIAPLQINHDAIAVEPGNGWHHVEVSVDFTTRRLRGAVRRPDGQRGEVDVALDPNVVSSQAEFRPGITWTPSGVTPGHKLRMDNVTLDWN